MLQKLVKLRVVFHQGCDGAGSNECHGKVAQLRETEDMRADLLDKNAQVENLMREKMMMRLENERLMTINCYTPELLNPYPNSNYVLVY